MARIENEFTWSFSRAQTFAACRRRYWFRYYAFWGGWSSDAPELARQAYRFSKMTTLPMVAGTAVHETIADLLRARRAGRDPGSPFEQVRRRMNDAWRASKEERWRTVGPKHAPPLFEHWYGPVPSQDELAALRDHALACMRGFLESELHRELVASDSERWRSIDELEKTAIGGVPCFVAPDFAFDRDGTTWLLDWKTGREREDHALQLLAYALFARQKWGLPPEKIRAFDVMLATGRCVEVAVTTIALEEATATIQASADAMTALLEDRTRNVARAEAHAATTDPRECQRCFFQQICDVRLPSPATGTDGAAPRVR